MKKSVFIAAAMSICLVFSSCGMIIINNPTGAEQTNPAETSAESGETGTTGENMQSGGESLRKKAENYLSLLPDMDTGGLSFIIAGPAATAFFPGEAATTVDIARYESLEMVKEKYYTDIITVESTGEDMLAELQAAIASGLYYADLMVMPERDTGSFYAADLLLNLRSIPFASLSSDYYDENSVVSSTIGNGVYSVSGDACENIDEYFAFYFNTDLTKSLQLSDLYSLTEEGKWTWELMLSCAKSAVLSLDAGSGYGAYGEVALWSSFVYSSAGLRFVENERGSLPVLSPAEETKETALSALRSVLSANGLYALPEGYDRYTAMREFYNGNMLFYADTLSETGCILDSEDNWGVLPVPKLTEEQESYITPTRNAYVFAVPKNNATLTETGLLLEAINAAEYEWVAEEYINFQMNYRVRDEKTLDMMDIIRENVYRDFSVLYGQAYPDLASACGGAFAEAAVTEGKTFAAVYGYL